MDKNNEKLKRFANDEAMAGAVYEVLLDAFLKDLRNVNDVQVLAAERLAVTFLKNAWRELEKFKTGAKGEEPIRQQVGL